MGWIAWTLSVATLVVGVIIIVIVMKQSSKESKSSITGGNTFYGANKGKTLDGLLSKLTIVFSIIFIILCFLTTIAITK
ncbi:MAG: preprotein translocase subunit SecG [Clostridia bacterium]|nr:preprotein translocase subunit SecG [Clostridia bacterium]MDD4375773.1 preprotein translocase subunit SecG [Clostridia bacterium]